MKTSRIGQQIRPCRTPPTVAALALALRPSACPSPSSRIDAVVAEEAEHAGRRDAQVEVAKRPQLAVGDVSEPTA